MIRFRTLMMLFLFVGLSIWVCLQAVERQYAAPPDLFTGSDYSQIEKGLYMGGLCAKPPPRVTAVLNLCEFEDAYHVKHHRTMTIADAEQAPSLKWLREAVGFVEEQRSNDRPTFVHCFAGISRSGMVVTAYLMKKNNWTRDEALAFVRKSRPEARPNPAFMELLLEWEKANRKRSR